MKYLEPTFSVGLTSEAYVSNWEKTFRPYQLQRAIDDLNWVTVARFAAYEDAQEATPEDGAFYRIIEG